MNQYIIDSNIAVKWFYEESFHVEAMQYLKSSAQLIAPDTIKQEFANTMVKKIRSGDTTPEIGWQCYEDLFRTDFLVLIPTYTLVKKAFDLAIVIHHTLYDCIYLAAAIDLNIAVITADDKFIDKVTKHNQYSPYIRWIERPPED